MAGRRSAHDSRISTRSRAADVRATAATLFERFDLLLCPSIAALAWPADEAFPPPIDGGRRAARPRNLYRLDERRRPAAANVPIAMTPDAGGIGMQFVAAPGRDRDLFDLFSTPRPSRR